VILLRFATFNFLIGDDFVIEGDKDLICCSKHIEGDFEDMIMSDYHVIVLLKQNELSCSYVDRCGLRSSMICDTVLKGGRLFSCSMFSNIRLTATVWSDGWGFTLSPESKEREHL
jgi:hypothetical protein